MTSSAERHAQPRCWTISSRTRSAGTRPCAATQGTCASGVRWTWLGDGILLLEPAALAADTRSVLASAGVHGDETAPIEMLSYARARHSARRGALTCRVLVILGNVDAMRDAAVIATTISTASSAAGICSCRKLRSAARGRARTGGHAVLRHRIAAAWSTVAHRHAHGDPRVRVRAFALLPHTGRPLSRAMFEWLAEARISAVLLHTTKCNTFSHFTAQACEAEACTLELGQSAPVRARTTSRGLPARTRPCVSCSRARVAATQGGTACAPSR